jgi:hypothetical protein
MNKLTGRRDHLDNLDSDIKKTIHKTIKNKKNKNIFFNLKLIIFKFI